MMIKKVSRTFFEDVNDLTKYLKKAKVNKIFDYHEMLSSEKPLEKGYNDFNSYIDAIRALEYGTDIYFESFKKNIKKVKDFLARNEKNKASNYKNDRVGFLPIVPKVLQGNPINMINQDVKPKPFPTARIVIEKGNSFGVKPETMNEFYSIIFVLIQLIESKGIRCEIWTSISSYQSKEIESVKVKLKNYTQPLNIYKIQFPIIASDFLRRIGLRLTEVNPDIKESGWDWGYGSPLLNYYNFKNKKDMKKIQDIIDIQDNDIYIPSCQDFNYSCGDDLDETIKRIIEQTNFKNYIELN